MNSCEWGHLGEQGDTQIQGMGAVGGYTGCSGIGGLRDDTSVLCACTLGSLLCRTNSPAGCSAGGTSSLSGNLRARRSIGAYRHFN
ncbi:hypothetical protein AFERRI_10023 [Acidithiobacillus ferrivorans]|uniref:Uncharacterized protein n=1 Tax=Acidithiobacillus ferrivorans TaxID=160808 RepID=A0A060UUU6_9PROT|nr:hypothetical protein AFERRI_10023 [Acidithiobacillus ferrivorans]